MLAFGLLQKFLLSPAYASFVEEERGGSGIRREEKGRPNSKRKDDPVLDV